jgi:hypothetical protein
MELTETGKGAVRKRVVEHGLRYNRNAHKENSYPHRLFVLPNKSQAIKRRCVFSFSKIKGPGL